MKSARAQKLIDLEWLLEIIDCWWWQPAWWTVKVEFVHSCKAPTGNILFSHKKARREGSQLIGGPNQGLTEVWTHQKMFRGQREGIFIIVMFDRPREASFKFQTLPRTELLNSLKHFRMSEVTGWPFLCLFTCLPVFFKFSKMSRYYYTCHWRYY